MDIHWSRSTLPTDNRGGHLPVNLPDHSEDFLLKRKVGVFNEVVPEGGCSEPSLIAQPLSNFSKPHLGKLSGPPITVRLHDF